MADVAFLLIIFFLVASFYSVTRGIQFSLPKHDEAALTADIIALAREYGRYGDRRITALLRGPAGR